MICDLTEGSAGTSGSPYIFLHNPPDLFSFFFKVFSAPNYCDTMGNKGAFITLTGGSDFEPKYTTYEAVEHPNVKPMAYANSLLSLFS